MAWIVDIKGDIDELYLKYGHCKNANNAEKHKGKNKNERKHTKHISAYI